MNKPLVHKKYQLEKFQGKGGWTFVRIPEILPDKKTPFGWVKVKGRIDDYEFCGYNLAPFGNGSLFFPVKAAIRKKINKKEGDWVEVVLFPDNDPVQIPDEFLECLRDEPLAYTCFHEFSDAEKKMYISWIYDSKKETTKISRMAKAIDRISLGLKLYDPLPDK